MSKRKKKNLGECAYCPETATTEDHVPPRGMFATSTANGPAISSSVALARAVTLAGRAPEAVSRFATPSTPGANRGEQSRTSPGEK
jgi:hypothetical protein